MVKWTSLQSVKDRNEDIPNQLFQYDTIFYVNHTISLILVSKCASHKLCWLKFDGNMPH